MVAILTSCYYLREPDDGLTQSSVPQSMFSLSAKLSDYPEYKELLQSYPSSSEDGPGEYNPEVINPSVTAAHSGFVSFNK